MILPFAAGGPLDGIGRILAARLSDVLGQQVVIQNVTGAGGTIGSNRVAKAAPDGYQFLLGHVGTHAFSQTLYKKPPYDAVTEFAPVSLVYHGLFLLLARKDLPVSTLAEFTAYAKVNQDTMQFGSAGAGSISHMACVLLNLSMGTKTTHVPYRGNAPAMQDLIAGRLDFMCDLHRYCAAADSGQCREGHRHSIARPRARAAESCNLPGAGLPGSNCRHLGRFFSP